MPHGTDWTRDEHIVAFNLYCRTPFGRMHKGNPEIIELAGRLGRTPSSVAMKLSNFARLDPAEQARGIRGLRSGSSLEAEIWNEFHSNWEQLAYESEVVKQTLSQPAPPVDLPLPDIPIGPTEVIRANRARLVQGFFRETVLFSYQSRCAICEMSERRLLIASHIIPWQADEKRRADPRNGLTLCALHDRAFDQGLIGIDESSRVMLSSRLKVAVPVPLHRAAFQDFEGKPLNRPFRFDPDPLSLDYHRRAIFQ
jgi:putative restriction endonuclease